MLNCPKLTPIRFTALPSLQASLNTAYTNPNKPENLPAYQEYADYLFEKAYEGDLDFNLPEHLKTKLDNLLKEKRLHHPPRQYQVEEEALEVIEASNLENTEKLEVLLSSKKFNHFHHAQMMSVMGWPYVSPSRFIQYSLDKIKGRLDMEKKYPQMSYEGRKKELSEFENNSGRYWFYYA